MKKLFSMLLMVLGICLMLGAVGNIYMVFTHQTPPVALFRIKGPQVPIPSLGNPTEAITNIFGSKKQAQDPETKTFDILPTESFNEILNIGATYWLMTFILSAGQKITGLGIELLRIPDQKNET